MACNRIASRWLFSSTLSSFAAAAFRLVVCSAGTCSGSSFDSGSKLGFEFTAFGSGVGKAGSSIWLCGASGRGWTFPGTSSAPAFRKQADATNTRIVSAFMVQYFESTKPSHIAGLIWSRQYQCENYASQIANDIFTL